MVNVSQLILSSVLLTCGAIGKNAAFLAAKNNPIHSAQPAAGVQLQRSSRKSRISPARHSYLGDGEDESMDVQTRMDLVRSLQKSFYAPSSTAANKTEQEFEIDSDDFASSPTHVHLDRMTGIIKNLPLWRVGWVEVPGRSNILNVHEGHYTNMFETVIANANAAERPLYVGHLHLPGGTKNARSGEKRFELKSWRDELKDETRFSFTDRSAVVGSLMRITDYRRMEDGRLCILVHVLERFVVDNVVRSFPYAVADVQILPDTEDLPEDTDENFCRVARAKAVTNALQYHAYEFANVQLPLPTDREYLPQDQVYGPDLAKLLPFASYSNDESTLDALASLKTTVNPSSGSFIGGQRTLEEQLMAGGILQCPPSLVGGQYTASLSLPQDCSSLETLIWLALDDFCTTTGFKLPKEIHCLMPPTLDYLSMDAPQQRISDKYPGQKRQQRLSYALPAIFESIAISGRTEPGMIGRQTLLNTPSTRARLISLLERLTSINESIIG